MLNGTESPDVLKANLQYNVDQHVNNVEVRVTKNGFMFFNTSTKVPIVEVNTFGHACMVVSGIKIGASLAK